MLFLWGWAVLAAACAPALCFERMAAALPHEGHVHLEYAPQGHMGIHHSITEETFELPPGRWELRFTPSGWGYLVQGEERLMVRDLLKRVAGVRGSAPGQEVVVKLESGQIVPRADLEEKYRVGASSGWRFDDGGAGFDVKLMVYIYEISRGKARIFWQLKAFQALCFLCVALQKRLACRVERLYAHG